MKNITSKFAFIFIILLSGSSLCAQKFSMSNTQIEYQDKERTGIHIRMAPDHDDVRDEFKDWLHDKYDFKLKGNGFWRNKDVMYAHKVELPTVSPDAIDLFAKIVKADNNSTKMVVFAALGFGLPITPERFPVEYRALENLTLNFLSEYLREYYRDKLEDQEDVVQDIKDKKADLQDDISDNKKEIEELQEENVELKKEAIEKTEKLRDAASDLEADKENLQKINQKLEAEKKSKIDNQ